MPFQSSRYVCTPYGVSALAWMDRYHSLAIPLVGGVVWCGDWAELDRGSHPRMISGC